MNIGIIKTNNNKSEFKILSKNCEKSDSKHTYYNIEFLESGYKDCVRSDSINKGLVKDGLSKSLYGVGMIGYINTREHCQEYKLWNNMISRCYNTSDKSYRYYGEKGVKVCSRWHRFDLFYNDIPSIVGYNKPLFVEGSLKLDKDILSNKENKIYSLQTTMWVSETINQKKRTYDYNARNKKYAIFPDGHIEQIFNVTDFCKNNGLHRQNVNLCLCGKQSATKGFKFYKE